MELSIAMIAKNEEKNLDRTLQALQCLNNKIDYEIIIVDTGSTDKTKDIAKNYTDKVYDHPWNGNFADMRNISLKYCTGDWILVIDADEVLENPEVLIEFMNSDKAILFKSAIVNFKNIMSENGNKFVYGSLVRMFKNTPDLKYVGRVHEQAVAKEPRATTNITFLHYGYSRDDYEVMNYKYERNKALLLEDLKNQKGVDRIYTLFQLAQTHSMANEEKESLKYVKEAYDITTNRKDGLINTYVLHFYAKQLYRFGEYEKAVNIALEGIQYTKTNLDYYYILAMSYFALGEYKKAESNFNKYFEIIEGREKNLDKYFSDDISLVESSHSDFDIILERRVMCYYKLKNYSRVIELFDKVKVESSINLLKEMFLYSCIKVGAVNKIKEHYKDKEFTDDDVEVFIGIIDRIECSESSFELKRVMPELKSFSKSLEYYLDVMDAEDMTYKKGDIDFTNFHFWKSYILRKLVRKDVENILLIRDCKSVVIEKYIAAINKNFECLKSLYEFTEKKFLVTNFKDLNFITLIEKGIVFNNSIADNKYKTLVERARVNRINFLKRLYSEEVLNSDYIYSLLNEYDGFILKSEKYIKECRKDKVGYIRRLRDEVREVPAFKLIINSYLENINTNPISDAMIEEKENVLMAVEQLINSNKLNDALAVLNDLEKIFDYDWKINNYLGIVNYMMGNLQESIYRLAIAEELSEDKFDATFNLACVLENMNRYEDAMYYYKRSYKLCDDEGMKNEIKSIIDK
ncbi:MAG: glycosyltransferase [Clostridium sp.]|nr:glycosyltransferase [Clostridium sp.]